MKGSDDSDDSDLGFYMPTVLANTGAKKAPVQKITKKIRKKKAKAPKQAKLSQSKTANPLSVIDQRKSSSLANPKLASSNPVLPAGSTVSGGILKQANSQAFMLESMDEKQILEYEIDQMKEKIRLKEEEARLELDRLRDKHKKAIDDIQKKHEEKLKQLEKEKGKLLEDKSRTVDLEKQKLTQLHKIDADQREIAHKKGLESQRELYQE